MSEDSLDVSVKGPEQLVVITDSYIEQDIKGLQLAYQYDQPTYYRGSLYIPGTRSFHDVMDDLTIPFGALKFTKAYDDAKRAFLRNTPGRVVGHSLGAAVAAELSKRYAVYDVGYGSPVTNSTNYADHRDIVGLFVDSDDLRNNQPYLHHGINNYRY